LAALLFAHTLNPLAKTSNQMLLSLMASLTTEGWQVGTERTGGAIALPPRDALYL